MSTTAHVTRETLSNVSDYTRMQSVAAAFAALDALTPRDRAEVAQRILNALPFDPEVYDRCRAEVSEQFPSLVSRKHKRLMAERAAERIADDPDYEHERNALLEEQIGDAVADSLEAVL